MEVLVEKVHEFLLVLFELEKDRNHQNDEERRARI